MSDPTPELINEWVRDAGALALHHFRRADSAYERKPDRSIVTEADTAVERFLGERIRAHFPGHGIVGEEGARTGGADPDAPVWILDPIDGTSNFAARLPMWCVSVGVFRGGRPWRGAVYLPAMDELYWVTAEGRALWNGRPIAVAERDGPEPTLLLTTNAHKWLHNRWPWRTLTLGAVAIDACLVGRGVASALAMRPNIWDIAAALAIAGAAGAQVTYLDGSAVDFAPLLAEPARRAPKYMLVAAPAFQRDALDHLSCDATFGVGATPPFPPPRGADPLADPAR